jgi:hypothetical protein
MRALSGALVGRPVTIGGAALACSHCEFHCCCERECRATQQGQQPSVTTRHTDRRTTRKTAKRIYHTIAATSTTTLGLQ